ncbi:MAG: Lipid flippase MurJ [Gaiellaceae bacterium]|nr:Lipid flippase MurJ [Gaiellaceae bacterium]
MRSGLLTGISTAAVSGSAAVLGVILARKFGHGVKTDGFFAAYGVYLGLVLVAGSLRVIVLPRFVAAHAAGRLAAEVGTWAAALTAPLALIMVVAIAWPPTIAAVLTSNPEAQTRAAQLLPWVVASAVAQIFGGLVASALAALDDYQWAAFGFAGGSIAGVVLTLALIGHGVVAFGWGLALNGALSLAIPLAPLLARRGVGRPDQRLWSRLLELGEGIALPLALQGLYVVAQRFASGLGTGRGTTFGYAYLIAAFLVAITASSVALVATVPFAREGSSPTRVAKHVVGISWLSLALVAGAAGVLVLVSEQLVRQVLGASYGGGTGAELGRLVAYLAPWMVASVAVTVTYPLVFVRGRGRWLPLLAAAALGAQVLLEWGARAAFGLAGVAAALALTTALVLAVLLARLGALERVARGLALAAIVCGGLAGLAFGLPRLVAGPIPAALAGLVAYCVVLAVWRPAGLRQAWTYVRTLQ